MIPVLFCHPFAMAHREGFHGPLPVSGKTMKRQPAKINLSPQV